MRSKRYQSFAILFIVATFVCCNEDVSTAKEDAGIELENFKNRLFKETKSVGDLPIFADAATGDYKELKDGKFAFTIDSADINKLWKFRTELEADILDRIDNGLGWVYLAAYLKYDSAVPKIKHLLLNEDNFYGWEGGDYDNIERFLEDGQYCYQMAYISAIEYITKKPITESITLSVEEYSDLKQKEKLCTLKILDTLNNACCAHWLLKKLRIEKKEIEPSFAYKDIEGTWLSGSDDGFGIRNGYLSYLLENDSSLALTIKHDTIAFTDTRTLRKAAFEFVVKELDKDSLIIYDTGYKITRRLCKQRKK